MTNADRRWSSSSNRSENFKFPDFDASLGPREHLTIYEEENNGTKQGWRTPSPNAPIKANGALHSERWQTRRDSHLVWSNGSAHPPGPRHGRQKSLSEAIRTIRTRNGSVSANAHEIAEALKAPVSFKLIVRAPLLSIRIILTATELVAMSGLVPEFGSDKHIIKVDSQCLSKACNPHACPVRLRFLMVLILRICRTSISSPEEHRYSSQIWNPLPNARRYTRYPSARPIPDWRTYPLIDGHLQNSGLPRPYHQRALSSLHRTRLPFHLPDPLL